MVGGAGLPDTVFVLLNAHGLFADHRPFGFDVVSAAVKPTDEPA